MLHEVVLVQTHHTHRYVMSVQGIMVLSTTLKLLLMNMCCYHGDGSGGGCVYKVYWPYAIMLIAVIYCLRLLLTKNMFCCHGVGSDLQNEAICMK